MWTLSVYKSFFKNTLLYMNSWLSNVRSVHTYVMPGRFILVESVQYVVTKKDKRLRCSSLFSEFILQNSVNFHTGHCRLKAALQTHSMYSTKTWMKHKKFVRVMKANIVYETLASATRDL